MHGQSHAASSPKPGTGARPSAAPVPRRGLLGGAGLALGAAVAPAGTPVIAAARAEPAQGQPASAEPPSRPADGAMRRRAQEVREGCARRADAVPIAPHPDNGDEARYTSRIASDTRG